MNNKGFMMAEVVVVSAIILVFMTGIYTSYNKIFNLYNQRVDYYDVNTLYKLAYYRDSLVDNTKFNKKFDTIISNSNEKVYLVYNNKKNLSESMFSGITLSSTFKDYIGYLSDSVNLTTDEYVLVMEKCYSMDDCKYSYLEVGE